MTGDAGGTRGKKVAILQSNYVPWRGYFDLIASVDEFILYDDMQYTKNDWRNRNLVKTPAGLKWLTVPVGQGISRRIRDVELADPRWQEKHWRTLAGNYGRAPHFSAVASWLEPLYRQRRYRHLSELNRAFIETICAYLGIGTKISSSWDYRLGEGRSERLVDLCQQAGGSRYLSGPAARGYLDLRLFREAGVEVEWFDYQGYQEYPQLWGEFAPGVTVLDLLFNCGAAAPRYLLRVGEGR